MSIPVVILGIIGFALVTAIIYVWGLSKSMKGDEALNRTLMSVCGNKVVKHLKKNGKVTKSEIAKIIEGITVGPVWSKKRLKVQDGKKAADGVIKFLTDNFYIMEINGEYTLRK